MDLKPISAISTPRYPTRREFLAKGTLFFLAANCGGCGQKNAQPIVAPVFDHGEGNGSGGCVVMTPPVFLSEEEAMLVIREELSKAGIQLGAAMPLAGVDFKYKSGNSGNWLGEDGDPQEYQAALNAVDMKKKIGVEFVSGKVCRQSYGTATGFPAKEFASQLAQAIENKGAADLQIGVFYDPLSKFEFRYTKEEDAEEEKQKEAEANLSEEEREQLHMDRFQKVWKRNEEEGKAKSRALLRQQSQDFVAWLKKQEKE